MLQNLNMQHESNWELFLKCQTVIEEQQLHISTLEEEISKKQRKINKLESSLKQIKSETQQNEQKDQLIFEQKQKIEALVHSNQCYEMEVENKSKSIQKLKSELEKTALKIQQNEETLKQIKMLYEAKIQKIQEETGRFTQTPSKKLITPTKAPTERKPLSSMLSSHLKSQEKTLINSPYLYSQKAPRTNLHQFQQEDLSYKYCKLQETIHETKNIQRSKKKAQRTKVQNTLQELQKRMKIMAGKLSANPEI